MGIFGITTETEGFVVMPETIGKSRLSKMHPGQLLTAGAAPFSKKSRIPPDTKPHTVPNVVPLIFLHSALSARQNFAPLSNSSTSTTSPKNKIVESLFKDTVLKSKIGRIMKRKILRREYRVCLCWNGDVDSCFLGIRSTKHMQ